MSMVKNNLLKRVLGLGAQPQTPDDKTTLRSCVVSDKGLTRPNNEDNYVLGGKCSFHSAPGSTHSASLPMDEGNAAVFGVFDGMGGGEAGELASRGSAGYFLQVEDALRGISDRQTIDMAIRGGFVASNNHIIRLQNEYKIYGTTGTVVCVCGNAYKFYHLGDSRGYLLRNGLLTQLTEDQTLAQLKIDMGVCDADSVEEADKHKLTDYIGRDWTCEHIRPVEYQWTYAESGDILLLCSDGLYDMCSDDEIAEGLMSGGSLCRRAQLLTDRANAHGGLDNITCLLIEFP